MSFNRKLLKQMTEESKQKKPQPKPKDRIVDPMGQWNHPGEITRIPSNRITMQGVPYPVLGVGNNGQQQMMYPGQEYSFPGSTYVDEFPLVKAQKGLTYLEPGSFFLPANANIPENSFSSERATSIGGERGQDAYLVPSFKYGRPLENPEGEFYKTGHHVGGPFKTWQEAEEFGNLRHQYIDKGYKSLPTPIRRWGKDYTNQSYGLPNKFFRNGGDISIPNLEEGNWLNIYDEGGLTTIETTRPPLYVTDKNDPRLRAYTDSLMLHNLNPEIADEVFKVNRARKKAMESGARLMSSGVVISPNNQDIRNFQNQVDKLGKFLHKHKINGFNYTNKILPSVKNPNYTSQFDMGENVRPNQMVELMYKKPVQPVILQQERPQIKMVGQDRIESEPSFNINVPARVSTIDRPKGNYAVDYFDENLQPQTNYFPTPEIADMFMQQRMENKMYGPSMSRRGVYQDGGPIPAYLKGPMRGDIQMRGNVNIPTQMAYDASQARKAQAAREATTIGVDKRTAAQKAKDRQAYESKLKYEKEVLGKDFETPQYLQEKNRARAEHLLHLADVGSMGAGLVQSALKAAPKSINTELILPKSSVKDAFKNTGVTLNEFIGELMSGKSNRKSIEEGNQWLQNWINHPATQAKIEKDMNNAIKLRSSVSNNTASDTYDLELLELIKNQSKSFKPASKEYSLKKQLEENLKQYFTPSDIENIHTGNWGISYMHGYSPEARNRIASGVTLPPNRYGSWVSRTPTMNQTQRVGTTIHEGTHDWVSPEALKKSGMRNEVLSRMDPKIKNDFLEWETLRNSGQDPEKIMGKDRAHQAYLADPTEVHARIMELRKHLGITPEYVTNERYTNEVIDYLKALPEYKRPVDIKLLNVIKGDPKKLSDLFNKMWAASPYGIPAAGVLGASQQKKKGGQTNWLDKYN